VFRIQNQQRIDQNNINDIKNIGKFIVNGNIKAEGGMDLESKHFSMISPMPGNTPPPNEHPDPVDQANDLRVIEHFLR